MLTDQELQSLRNLGNDAERAANEIENLRAALRWYAERNHFVMTEETAWDTVSGEPQNWWADEAGTAMVEDGTLARKVLSGELTGEQLHALDD